MAIAKTAVFAVHPESLARCEEVIREFVDGVTAEEPGTRVYVSLRQRRDPTRFVHVMVFDDDAAEAAHRDAERTRRFTAALYPHTLEGVAFTDCSLVAPAGNEIEKTARRRHHKMGNPTVFFEVAGPDQKGLIDFYTQLFGWQTNDIPGDMPYSLVTPGEGGTPGGIGPTPDGSQGHVTFYVGVDDIAGALDKAESLGGSKIMGPVPVPGGEIGLFTDPEGHVIGVWSGDMQGNGASAGSPVVWFEVIGKDANALRSFYGELFGWNFEVMEEMDYGMVTADANGGGIPGGVGSAQGTDASYQTVYAGVDDVQGALDKAESLGAKTVMPPMDLPMGGKIALFQDPQGHTFGLFKPPPDQG